MNSANEFDVGELLRLAIRSFVLPVIHGSGQFSLTVRRWMLEQNYDCVAIPLPESFQIPVEEAVLDLPRPSIVIQPSTLRFGDAGSYDSHDWEPNGMERRRIGGG